MAKVDTAKILLRGLVQPKNWSSSAPAAQLRVELEKLFSLPVYPVNSGRSALYLLLRAANIGGGDEVIVQSYTCNAVPNPIIWTGAKPVYADIEGETLNVDPVGLESKISPKTKAIVLQHTFGRPGPIERVLEIAKKHSILVIEDCAHSLGAEEDGQKLGTFGDAAILSFGREKVISSLSGGAAVIKNKDLIGPIEEEIKKLQVPPYTQFLKETNNFFTWRLVLRRLLFTNFSDKILGFLNEREFFNVVTSNRELVGQRPDCHPALYPGTLAEIALLGLSDLEKVNKDREKIARYYEQHIKNSNFIVLKPHGGVYLRFVVLSEKSTTVFAEAKKRKIWLGNWYDSPVYPKRVSLQKLEYTAGSCPVAERKATTTINLPLYQGMDLKKAQEVVDFLNNFKE